MLFQDFLTTVNNLINVRFHDLWNYDSQVLLIKTSFFFLAMARHIHKNWT